MGDYHSWLDNIAAADMRASKYFVDKVQILYTVDHARNKDMLTHSGPLMIVYFAPLQGPNGSSASLPEEFPNFQNQFLSGDFSGF